MILPIGEDCTLATIMKMNNTRKYSYPFDWILCSIIKKMELYTKILVMNEKEISKYVDDLFDISNGTTYIQNYNQQKVFSNTKENISFPHDILDNMIELKNKYIRRIERTRKHFFTDENVIVLFNSKTKLSLQEREYIINFVMNLSLLRKDIKFISINSVDKDNNLNIHTYFLDYPTSELINFKNLIFDYYQSIWRNRLSSYVKTIIDDN